jgi:hypothetical protein
MTRLITAVFAMAMAISCVGRGGSDTIGKVRIPYSIAAEGYPAHVQLSWNDNVGSTYDIYRATQSGRFSK